MKWVEGKERLLLVIILVAGAFLTGLVLYNADHHVFIYSGDASSHLVRTRQFVDSQQPGIHNIGTAWLPLPHLLLLPFATNDFLFYNGLAAVIPGIVCLIGTALALFGIIRRLTASSRIALLGALVFGLNPNILYLSLIPMSEASFLLFLSTAAYCLLRWLEEPAALRWQVFCSALLICATLTRYETWPLPFAFTLISIFLLASRRIPGGRGKRLLVLANSLGSFLGILAWLYWNRTEYGNALQFAKAIYDIGPSESRAELAGHPGVVLMLYIKTVLYMFGPVLLGLALGAIGRQRPGMKLSLFYGFLLLPPLFTIISLEEGFAQMDQWWWNSRYVLPIGVPLLIAGCTVLHRLWTSDVRRNSKFAMAAAFFSFSLVQVTIPSIGVITFTDAAKGFFEQSVYATEVGERLGEIYNGGDIALVTDVEQSHRVMIPSRIPIQRFHVMDGRDSARSRSLPWVGNRYVVLCKEPDPETKTLALFWLHHFGLLAAHYVIISENPEYLLLERREDHLWHNIVASVVP